jgi:hypothetical protein
VVNIDGTKSTRPPTRDLLSIGDGLVENLNWTAKDMEVVEVARLYQQRVNMSCVDRLVSCFGMWLCSRIVACCTAIGQSY